MTAPPREKDPLLAAALMALYAELKDKTRDPAFLFVLKGTLEKFHISMEEVEEYKKKNRERLLELMRERGQLT